MTLKMKSFRPRPHLMRFCLNDAYISMRLGLLSPLIRLAFSSKSLLKVDQSLNANISYWCEWSWMVENGRNRIKMKTMTQNIAGACVCSIGFNLRRTIYCGQSKKHQNETVEANRLMRFRWQRKRIQSVDRALVFEYKARKRDSID